MPTPSSSCNGYPPTAQSTKLIQGWADEDAVTFIEQLGLKNGWRQFLVATVVDVLVPALRARGLSPGFEPENQNMFVEVVQSISFKPKKKGASK